MLKLYNTASRKVENFKPRGEVVKIYTCGPTVYNFQHIGNYASYVYWDLLLRVLKYDGYKTKRVLNLTDVGHLESDADDGQDKLEKGAAREGKTVWEVAEFYSDDFMSHFRALNLIEPDVVARATDYVEEDMQAVDKMTENGFTYETTDGVYYDTSKFPGYADFARLNLEGLKAGARINFNKEKRNVSDFAVWKFIQPGEKHAMRWDYLGRPGYPGWHLECSTIINKELGEPIDIHTGGIDHIPVHHTNEIAQTYAISGQQLARFWLHCSFITIDGEKISKSLGNFYTLDDLKERGFSYMDYKMWVLAGHYQGTRNFTFESLESAKQRRLNWRNKIALLYQSDARKSSDDEFTKDILSILNNNLNSPEAFAYVDTHELSMDEWKIVDDLFGLNLIADTPDIDDETHKLILERQTARENKDFKRSDEIRDDLKRRGIIIEDSSEGPIWQYAA
ncbi:cysteine--tRNA ligase [Candidatus Saccharibacteria bacterium]|nr:cysteine--tRNA ligase [Candidatus Saccharibacteria bacterium]